MKWIKLSERRPIDFSEAKFRCKSSQVAAYPVFFLGQLIHFSDENGIGIDNDLVEWTKKGTVTELSKRLQVALSIHTLIDPPDWAIDDEIKIGHQRAWAKELLTLADVLIKADSETMITTEKYPITDFVIDTHSNGTHNFVMKITHIPSGESVSNEGPIIGGRYKTNKTLMSFLIKKLEENKIT